jgi:hypothetical protein
MAGRNSWTFPGSGILGGVALGSGIPRPDDPNAEYETLWAQSLREAIEKRPGGDTDRLAALAEQVRGGAIHTGPVDPIANSIWQGIEYLRKPAPPQMPQERTIGPGPYMAPLPRESGGPRIAKAIIDHYADYFDPWAKDELGRHVVETPAFTTPNAAGKTPLAEKPWWWPIVGGIDIGSNFAGPGAGVKAATVGGRAAFAASKAAAAEAVPTGKLLNAIREGQLAKLAGEGTTSGGAPSSAASAMGEYHVLGGADGSIFRNGGQNPSNLIARPKDNGVLSFRDSLSNPYPLPPGQRPVLIPGEKYREFDSSKLPPGSVIRDNNPPGHVGVRGVSLEDLINAITGKGTFPR